MSLRVKAALRGDLQKMVADEIAGARKAVTRAATTTAQGLKEELRSEVRGAGLGGRIANAWRSQHFPRSGESMKAAAFVWSKAPAIVAAHRGTTIRSKDGFFLAIPTEAAPKRGVGNKRITPSNFPEQRFGPLRFVFRRGRPSLLVVDGVRVGASGRIGRRLKGGGRTKSGDFRSGVSTVVMFILVPQVRLPKRLDPDAIARRWEDRFPALIAAGWPKAGQP